MLVPDQVRVDKIEGLAKEVMLFCRDTLTVKMRFLSSALSRLELLSSTWPLATDGERLLYDPVYILHLYAKEKNMSVRSYFHVILHCIFQHFYVDLRIQQPYWDLACDMAVENIITEIGLEATKVNREVKQQEQLLPIKKEQKRLTAETIYRYLLRHPPKEEEIIFLSKLFWADTHDAWYIASVTDEWNPQGERSSKEEDSSSKKEGDVKNSSEFCDQPDRLTQKKQKQQEQWAQVAQQMQIDLETFSKSIGERASGLMQNLADVTRETYDYRKFLEKFMSVGEVMQLDEDEFDYIFYTYGLQLYGSIPLIEPLEYKEVKRIKEFVIALDTSGSIGEEQLRGFLQKTYQILTQQETFFQKMNLHILQCDAIVQEHVKIACKEDMERYFSKLTRKGAGGTDFRPAFHYVDDLIQRHEFENLKGMLYFTDGKGKFPKQPPGYQVAFVFVQEEFHEIKVPPWAMKVVLQSEELFEKNETVIKNE